MKSSVTEALEYYERCSTINIFCILGTTINITILMMIHLG